MPNPQAILLPIIKNAMPKTIAKDLLSAQPMAVDENLETIKGIAAVQDFIDRFYAGNISISYFKVYNNKIYYVNKKTSHDNYKLIVNYADHLDNVGVTRTLCFYRLGYLHGSIETSDNNIIWNGRFSQAIYVGTELQKRMSDGESITVSSGANVFNQVLEIIENTMNMDIGEWSEGKFGYLEEI